ncbi:flagellar protein FlgJ [Rosenbergiella nectarea]|uniref:Flagellar protein FlgJ n=1 Tax=Rosenbergiella nectarea TaxID=988801 RepID=A0A1H9JZW8_9GAMM|nr:rod-binding protein [Rosenbergiella nectarea]SEQ92203.1 flagellar protein FlgJ [Rosenbergiella nectarea]
MTVSLASSMGMGEALVPGDIGNQQKPHTLSQAAEQFENQFLRQMIKEMRHATDALVKDSPVDSKQQALWRDFYDDQLSANLAATHSTGLAEMIVKQLSPKPTPSEIGSGGRSESTEQTFRDQS